jgi:uncharacterized phage protein gp47/JayE
MALDGTCLIARPDPQVIFDRLSGQFSATVLRGAPIIPESNEWWVVTNDYKVQEEFYAYAEQLKKELDPRYACCDNLTEMASNLGVYPAPANFAHGYVTLTGVAGSALVPGMQISFGPGIYRVANPATVPSVMPATGSITLRFQAVQPGTASNAPQAAESGLLITPLTGIDQAVTVHGAQFCGGAEGETCEPFRNRYLDRLKYRPNANFAWLEQKALEWPCVTRVCLPADCCDTPQDCATHLVRLHVMFDDTFEHGVAPDDVIEEVQTYLFGPSDRPGSGLGVAPINVDGRVIPVVAAPVDIIISGLSCATIAQKTETETRIRNLFKNICPGNILCRNVFIATVAQVVPNICDFDVTVSTTDPDNIEITLCGDIEPVCSVLPYLNSLKVV